MHLLRCRLCVSVGVGGVMCCHWLVSSFFVVVAFCVVVGMCGSVGVVLCSW
jgi:hypothetical protein